jgi:TRAP-type transport system periplasmic protein
MKAIPKIKMVLLMFILILVATACGQQSSSGENTPSASTSENTEQIVFDLSISSSEGAYTDLGAKKFKEELERLTDGQLSAKIYYNNTFGGEREVIEMMGINSLDMAGTSSGPLPVWTPEFGLFDLPFLIKSHEHAFAIMDGEIGDRLKQKFEEDAGVKILAYWTNGFRQMTNSVRPVNTVEDVSGIKHRVQENQIQMDTWKAFGADPTPIAFPELYTSLQQGVVDGQSNLFYLAEMVKLYEVQKYGTVLNENYALFPLMMSKQLFESLSPEHQEAVLEAAKLSEPVAREAFVEQEENAYNVLVENGVEIVDEPDRESFKAKVESVYEKWVPELGEELIEEVRNLQ